MNAVFILLASICVILYANKLLTVWNISLRTKLNDWDGAAIYGNQLRSWARVDLYKGCTPPLGGACHTYFKNSPSEVIVRNNEGQLFHSYILLKWFTQGNGTPFRSRSGQKRALCIGRVSENAGNFVLPMTRLTPNSWFKSPTQSPPPPSEKNRDYNANGNCAKNSIIIIWRHRNGERIFQFSNFVFMNYLL